MTDPDLPNPAETETSHPGVPDPEQHDRNAPPADERPREDPEQEEAAAIEMIRTDPALRREASGTDASAPTQEQDDPLRVQWVRPTDLAARAGARVLEKGMELNQHNIDLARQTALEAARDARGRLRQALARREHALTPDTPDTAATPVLGRQGVSR